MIAPREETSYRTAPDDAEELVTLSAVLIFLKRSVWLIGGAALTALVVATIYVLAVPPEYVAGAQILIEPPNQRIFIENARYTAQSIDSAEVESQVEVLKSDGIAGAVIDKLHLIKDPEFRGDGSALPPDRRQVAIARFEGRLSAHRVDRSYIIGISFVSRDPRQAARITNAIAKAYLDEQLQAKAAVARQASKWLQQRISDLGEQLNAAALAVQRFKAQNGIIQTASDQGLFVDKLTQLEARANAYRRMYEGLLQKLTESVQQETFPVSDARIVTPASTPLRKSYPKTHLVLVLSVILGLMAGLGIAFVRHIFDRTVRDPAQTRRALGLASLGLLPLLQKTDCGDGGKRGAFSGARPTPLSSSAAFDEALRGVKASLDIACRGKPGCAIGVTSLRDSEGKSSLCLGLGTLFARAGARTLLIDADGKGRSLSQMLAPAAPAGLIEALAGQTGDHILLSDRIGAHVLPIGGSGGGAEAIDALAAPAMQTLLGRLRQSYDVILVDLPASPAALGTRAVGPFLDGSVIVAEYGRTRLDQLEQMVELLRSAQAPVLGFVINKLDERIPPLFGIDLADWRNLSWFRGLRATVLSR